MPFILIISIQQEMEKHMNKIVLFDGHSILNRAFYGIPDLTNSKGIHTNAVYGFLNIMFKILEEEKPDYMAVAFDLKDKTFRHKMYEAYKGTRKPMPAELHEQVPVIKDVLLSMNIKILELPGYEADDILGTMAKAGEKAGFDVRIISGDRDLLQLATSKIMIRIPKTKKGVTEIENYFEDDVKNLYGVTPTEFIDMKALMGDASDNIPGVKNIGEKTASTIISTFGSIENAYEHHDEIKPKRAGDLLAADYENARLSKILATINTDSPVNCDIRQCKIENMFNENAYVKMQSLEFKSLLQKFNKSINQKAATIDISDKYISITDTVKLNKLREISCFKDKFSLTCYNIKGKAESRQLTFDFLNNKSPDDTDCEDKLIITLTGNENIFIIENTKELNADTIKDTISELISQTKLLICQDVKKVLKTIDFSNNYYNSDLHVNDLSIGAYLLNPLKDSYSTDDIARDYLNEVTSVCDIIKELPKELENPLSYNVSDDMFKALATEGYILYKSDEIIINKIKSEEMYDLYNNIEIPLAFALNDMENEGVYINRKALKEYGSMLKERIDICENKIYEEIGEKFNINSPKQLGEILFVKLQIPGGKKTKTGYSTSAEVLNKLAEDYPVVKEILTYRQLTKLKSTYADGLDAFISSDGRIHGTFNQTITATGRISSTEPNLQNIPIRMDIGKRMREIFEPKEDCVFIDADYSQIELRILAHMSCDENLIEAYNSHQDIHRITASKVFKVPFEEVTDAQRRNAKAVNFGIVYGISSFGLSQDLSISKKEATEYIKQYFETYGKIKDFLDKSVEDAKKTGYAKTIYGRKRPVPELSSSNFMQRSFGERIAMNSPIQGTAADIMKIAMISVADTLRKGNFKSKIVLQVHDELLIEAPENEAEEVMKIVKDKMQHAANLKVKLEVGIGIGKNWLEAH